MLPSAQDKDLEPPVILRQAKAESFGGRLLALYNSILPFDAFSRECIPREMEKERQAAATRMRDFVLNIMPYGSMLDARVSAEIVCRAEELLRQLEGFGESCRKQGLDSSEAAAPFVESLRLLMDDLRRPPLDAPADDAGAATKASFPRRRILAR